jgi:hypothetical protein
LRILKTEFRAFDNNILSNLPVIIALTMLGSAPLFILQDELYTANQLAGYAYYFLIVGILWKIVQYWMNSDQHKNEIPDISLGT